MATTSKLSFRARNLDANRGMKVFYVDELPDISECAPIARGVNPMPTGMEKEEEMETHLQEAIHAQQASTSGISDNHVIPTPKVLYIDEVRYDEAYPVQPPVKAQLMKVSAWLTMERDEAEYDMDSEDEEYLRDKPHINPKDLESIMEKLEAQSSESAICQPATARKVLIPQFDDNIIDDVYDYWLSKRKDAATNKTLGFGGLIPRIRTECRKENEKLNPYVAFRRRAEKMQTRKNRKNDEDSYEKVLRLGHDLRRAVHLFEMVKRREKSKLAIIELDSEILETRGKLGDYGSVVYNQILARLQPEDESTTQQQPSRVPPLPAAATDAAQHPLRAEENGIKRKKMRKRVSGLSANFERDLPSKAWLKKNAEVWNQSPTAFISGMSSYTPAVEQVDQSVAAANTANADGRFAFKRKRGCYYRCAIPLKDNRNTVPRLDSLPPERRFHYVSLPSTSRDVETQPEGAVASESVESTASATSTTSTAAATTRKALLRRRIGRGGRVVFDQFPRPSTQSAAGGTRQRNGYVAGRTGAVIYDPFELDCVAMDSEESSRWQARRRGGTERVVSEDEEDYSCPPISSRYLHSRRYRSTWHAEDEETDAATEAAWLASAVSPSPSPEPPRTEETEAEEEEEMETDDPPPTKRPTPPDDSTAGAGEGGSSSNPTPTTQEEALPTPLTPTPQVRMKSRMMRDVMVNQAKNGANGAAAARIRQQEQEERAEDEHEVDEEEEEEEGMEVGRACSEDSPTTSSSEADHHDNTHPLMVPLGEAVAGAVHHHHLHLAAGNALVLSPPDSTAPSPRVSNGGSSASSQHSLLSLSASPMAAPAASPAPHSNGHNGHAGSGNGVASGYEAAADAAHAVRRSHAHAASDNDADAWRVRAKLVTMEAVASRLTRVKDPDASSRESGCSPTDKSLPSPDGEEGGVVVQLVEPWREASNSPSQSNSSSDYTPPASTRTSGDVDARLSAYATLSSEEESGARTGDHPALPAKPTRKPNGVTGVQLVGLQRSFALAAATTP